VGRNMLICGCAQRWGVIQPLAMPRETASCSMRPARKPSELRRNLRRLPPKFALWPPAGKLTLKKPTAFHSDRPRGPRRVDSSIKAVGRATLRGIDARLPGIGKVAAGVLACARFGPAENGGRMKNPSRGTGPAAGVR